MSCLNVPGEAGLVSLHDNAVGHAVTNRPEFSSHVSGNMREKLVLSAMFLPEAKTQRLEDAQADDGTVQTLEIVNQAGGVDLHDELSLGCLGVDG